MATKSIAWQTGSGNITLTYQGQGDAPVTVQSDANDGAARSQVITIETTAGSPVVTKNLTIRQGACPVPVGTVLNYAYTGSYQEVELPAGQYKLQCWGAQGGSNAAASSYGITAKAGGEGGYSEGVLTLTSKTTVRIYVGGAGSSSAGGFNGGGSTTGTSQYSTNDEFGYSKMGGGGGATDIRLSDGALLSRMIVAGGGSGGAMCYRAITTTETVTTETVPKSQLTSDGGYWSKKAKIWMVHASYHMHNISVTSHRGETCTIKKGNKTIYYTFLQNTNISPSAGETLTYATGYSTTETASNTDVVVTVPSDAGQLSVWVHDNDGDYDVQSVTFTKQVSSTTTSTYSRVGYEGGGESAAGWHNGTYYQPGRNGSFGAGANVTVTNYRYVGAAGGGGWYGGGNNYSNSDTAYVNRSGGGSGWVNIAANASYRPSGYTGLQLDSGETKAGNTSIPSTSGGTEIGHSGNGYARITRLS